MIILFVCLCVLIFLYRSQSDNHYLTDKVLYLSDSPIDFFRLNLGVTNIVSNQIGL